MSSVGTMTSPILLGDHTDLVTGGSGGRAQPTSVSFFCPCGPKTKSAGKQNTDPTDMRRTGREEKRIKRKRPGGEKAGE